MGNVARMAEVCFQDDCLQGVQTVAETGMTAGAQEAPASLAWFALVIHQYKREQCELMLARMGYEYLSPCVSVVREWSDRQKRMQVPLFPGYIFCRFNPEKRLALLTIPGVRAIVGSGKRFLEVDSKEIEAIRVALASRLPVERFPDLPYGQKVKVIQGPLRGVEGRLVRMKAQSRLLLSVTMLNRFVSVEVEAHQLAVQS
jgi:transcription antitermination factor NusG